MGLGRGMGRAASEGGKVLGGIFVVCMAGAGMYGSYAMAVADRVPGTFAPQWKAATVKYRAAQNQDPITGN